MSTFSGRSLLRAALVGGATAALLTLTGCSGTDDDPEPDPATPTAPSLSSLGELRGLTMIDTSWEAFRTAKVTAVTGRPDARAVDVTYETTDATCEALAGFAERRTDDQLLVTIVIGHEDDCEPGAPTTATTSVPLTEPLGTVTPAASPFSKESIEIG